MKRQSLLILLFAFLCSIHAQKHVQKVQYIDQSLFIIEENGAKYAVNTDFINVKPKYPMDIKRTDIKPVHYGEFGYIDIEVPKGTDIQDYVNKLKKSGEFEVVEYIGEAICYSAATDILADEQLYLDNLHYDDVWNFTTGNPNIKVGIIDTGVLRSHPDIGYGSDSYTNISYSLGYDYLAGSQYQMPTNYHGTNVAGIIGAKRNNNIGIAGIAGGNNSPGVTILSYCAISNTPNLLTLSYIGDAIKKAVDQGAKVINISAGMAHLTKIDEAIDYAYNHGVAIVCAAGNEGYSSISYPASNSKTIAVGGATNTGIAKSGLNYGVGLDIIAPAELTTTTDTNPLTDYYSHIFGFTSCAAAIVTGTVALMLSVNPSLTPDYIRYILRSTANKPSAYSYDSNGWNQYVGYGLLNPLAAVFGAMNLTIEGPRLISTTGSYSISNLPNGVNVLWSLSDPYYNAHNLGMTSYPLTTGCYISRSDDQDMVDATLTARIRYNNTTIRTLTKTGLYAYEGFKGHYTSGNLSDNIDYTYYFNIRPNATTYIQSPNFIGATVSYSTTAAIPTIWGHNSSDGDLTFVSTSTTTPVVINVTDMCGNHYTLYAAPQSSYNMNVLSSESGISVMLNEEESLKGLSIDHSWTVEVINAETGRVMATQSSMNRSETISTAGWPKGIYVVKVTIGKEELTEKVMVK